MKGFLVVCFAASCFAGAIAWWTRGITFFGQDTDNEKHVRAARQLRWGAWPSTVHAEAHNKSAMKLFFVVLVAIAQRLLRDRVSDRPLVLLCLLAHSLSAVLVYTLADHWWGLGPALLSVVMLLGSFWPWLVALFGGPVCIAQTCLLVSAGLMELAASTPSLTMGWAAYGLAGIAVGLTQSSSGSSRKYLPLAAGAFFYSQREALISPASGGGSLGPVVVASILSVAAGLALGVGALWLTYRRVITAIYVERAPRWLNRAIAARARVGLEYYLQRGRKLLRILTVLALGCCVYWLGCLALTRSASFYAAQAALACGFGLVFFWLAYPRVLDNVRLYLLFANAGKWAGHFDLYVNYFAGIGKPIPNGMRGAGWLWVARYFWRVAPVHCVFVLFIVGALPAAAFLEGFQPGRMAQDLAMLVLGFSPVLVGELTRGPQFGRSYFPGLIGMVLVIGYGAFRAQAMLPPGGQRVFWVLASLAAAASAAWNTRVFLEDVWPSRMAPAWLARTLQRLGATSFSTYDTPYNGALVHVLPPEVRRDCEIRFIRTLGEVRAGYVVVPGTSAKAVNMESNGYSIVHGDFDQDPVLNELLASREIERYAVAWFKTVGTSRIWVHESEVPSYRDLILREIGEEDRWRGRAWILDGGKLAAARAQRVRGDAAEPAGVALRMRASVAVRPIQTWAMGSA